jgi:hypothetical protein
MGEMADMLLDQSIDEWDSMEHWYSCRPRKVIECYLCKKKNLKWHNVKGHWVLFEPDGSRLHTCKKGSGVNGVYTAPLEVLKELAHQTINLARMKELDKLYNRMMNAGGFKKIANVVTDAQLIDLFIRLNREHNVDNRDDIGWGTTTDYSKQLAQLRNEILKRMAK